MDKLLDLQQQLSRVAADVAEHSQRDSIASSSAAQMTPVLIHIEQLLDEIRASTRAIVAKASRQGRPDPRPIKRQRTDDFRAKLESEDVVDYESETETEDEAAADQGEDADEMEEGEEEEEEEKEEDDGDGDADTGGPVSSKLHEGTSQENGDESEEKSQESKLSAEAAAELEKQLKKCVKSFISITKKAAELNEKADVDQVGRVMATISRWSTESMTKLFKLIRGAGVPSVEIATDFCDATMALPSIIERHRSQRPMNQKWHSTTVKRLQQMIAIAKGNPDVPKCLSDPKMDATREQLKELATTNEPDFLHQMEAHIARVKSQEGGLDPDRIDKPMGKLASLFHHDFKLCSRRPKSEQKPPRTEENWRRFAQIGEVLAEWILASERATLGPNLPPHLGSFERQLRGFAKKNPGRVPASLLEASAVLKRFAKAKTRRKR